MTSDVAKISAAGVLFTGYLDLCEIHDIVWNTEFCFRSPCRNSMIKPSYPYIGPLLASANATRDIMYATSSVDRRYAMILLNL